MVNINVCQWLDSNCGPLELEVTALPTEPQPLPHLFLCVLGMFFFCHSFFLNYYCLHMSDIAFIQSLSLFKDNLVFFYLSSFVYHKHKMFPQKVFFLFLCVFTLYRLFLFWLLFTTILFHLPFHVSLFSLCYFYIFTAMPLPLLPSTLFLVQVYLPL